jgi:hypothetical protein
VISVFVRRLGRADDLGAHCASLGDAARAQQVLAEGRVRGKLVLAVSAE